jgi:hypothetical protein
MKTFNVSAKSISEFGKLPRYCTMKRRGTREKVKHKGHEVHKEKDLTFLCDLGVLRGEKL